MWENNKYMINGKVVGTVYERDPGSDGYKAFPYAYCVKDKPSYVASSLKEARRQVERTAS